MNLKYSSRSITLALAIPAFFAFLIVAKLNGAESEITFESPDARFGIRNFEDGRVELVALPSRKRVLKLDLYGEIEVTWAPDSRRLTAVEGAFEDGVQFYEPKMYEREGASFRPVKLPNCALAPDEWPGKKGRKAARGREFILPARWIDANTLVLKRECLCNIFSPTGEETDQKKWSVVHEITISIDGKHHASVQKLSKIEAEAPK
jgi:hypothetical protein